MKKIQVLVFLLILSVLSCKSTEEALKEDFYASSTEKNLAPIRDTFNAKSTDLVSIQTLSDRLNSFDLRGFDSSIKAILGQISSRNEAQTCCINGLKVEVSTLQGVIDELQRQYEESIKKREGLKDKISKIQ